MRCFFYFITIITLFYSESVFAQEKYEKESRIKYNQIPIKALDFFKLLNTKNKIKWFKEENLSKTTFEAKFKLDKLDYSVEFDSIGNIEDIEVLIDIKNLDINFISSVNLYLNQNCVSHKINKIQIQYSGNEIDLATIFTPKQNNDKLNKKYEIIVKCKSNKTVDLFEYLFNEKGKYLTSSKIIQKNSSHLEY